MRRGQLGKDVGQESSERGMWGLACFGQQEACCGWTEGAGEKGPGHAGPCQSWGRGLGELTFWSESDGRPLQGSKQGDDWFRFCQGAGCCAEDELQGAGARQGGWWQVKGEPDLSAFDLS